MIKRGQWASREEQMTQILEDISEAKILGAKVYRPAYMATSPEVLKGGKKIFDLIGLPVYLATKKQRS